MYNQHSVLTLKQYGTKYIERRQLQLLRKHLNEKHPIIKLKLCCVQAEAKDLNSNPFSSLNQWHFGFFVNVGESSNHDAVFCYRYQSFLQL